MVSTGLLAVAELAVSILSVIVVCAAILLYYGRMPLLLIILRKGPKCTRESVTRILARVGTHRITRGLTKTLCNKGEDWGVRRNAAKVLEEIGWCELVQLGPPALEPLLRLLLDKDSQLRESAAMALGKIGDKRAIPALQKLWRETDISIGSLRLTASDALRRIDPNVDPGGRSKESWLIWDHEIYVPKPQSQTDSEITKDTLDEVEDDNKDEETE